MLEFLVTEMGFSIFAIEANLPEAQAVNQFVLEGKGDPAAALAGLYFWTWNTQEVLDMIEWMRRYNQDPSHACKIKFYGFDMQTPTVAAQNTTTYLGSVDPEYAKSIEAILSGPDRNLAGVEGALKRFDNRRQDYMDARHRRSRIENRGLGAQRACFGRRSVVNGRSPAADLW